MNGGEDMCTYLHQNSNLRMRVVKVLVIGEKIYAALIDLGRKNTELIERQYGMC